MTDFITHGRIVGGTIGTPDIALALIDYRDRLGLRVVENGTLGRELADSWGCAALFGARFATMAPASGVPCFVRLVEQPLRDDFVPTRTYGWAAFEITVQDVFGWPAVLADSGFTIVGEPKEIPGLPYFVALQMLGRGQEMVYLNEVRKNTPTSDLPRAQSPTDHLFIAILATPDRARTMGWYADKLGLEEGGQYTIPYTMISRAFGQPLDTMHSISMAQVGRLPIVEIDDYPAQATARTRDAGSLPPGNAIVTLAIDSLDRGGLQFITPAAPRDGAFYRGMRSATVIGSAGELIELVEIPR